MVSGSVGLCESVVLEPAVDGIAETELSVPRGCWILARAFGANVSVWHWLPQILHDRVAAQGLASGEFVGVRMGGRQYGKHPVALRQGWECSAAGRVLGEPGRNRCRL